MNKAFYGLLLTTTLVFWTCVHKPGGSLEYYLVLKPYPSSVLFVGGGEEKIYNERLSKGQLPDWLVKNNYIEIARGSWEESTKPWEYIRFFLIFTIFVGWPITIGWSIVRLVKHAVNRLSQNALKQDG